jgi:hypothetical protein
VTPFVIPFDFAHPQNTIETALQTMKRRGRLRPGSTVVVISLVLVDDQVVDAVQMRTV